MNTENLVSLKDRTTDEQREIARQGGIASGESRRERKKLRELLEVALCEPYIDLIDGMTDITNGQKVVLALIEKAQKGDTKAFQLIRDTVGEMPVQKASIETPTISPEAYREVERLLLGDED